MMVSFQNQCGSPFICSSCSFKSFSIYFITLDRRIVLLCCCPAYRVDIYNETQDSIIFKDLNGKCVQFSLQSIFDEVADSVNLTADTNKLELIRSNRKKKQKLQNGASLILYANEKSKIIAQSSAADEREESSVLGQRNELEKTEKQTHLSRIEGPALSPSIQPDHLTHLATPQIQRDYFTLDEIRKLSLLHNIKLTDHEMIQMVKIAKNMKLTSDEEFGEDFEMKKESYEKELDSISACRIFFSDFVLMSKRAKILETDSKD